MKRVILALTISPFVVPFLILLLGGLRPNLVGFAASVLPVCYALTLLAGLLIYLAREVTQGNPRFWTSVVIGFGVGAGFLFFWARDSLDHPHAGIYLVYAGFGVITTAVGHWIAFGFKRHSAIQEKA